MSLYVALVPKKRRTRGFNFLMEGLNNQKDLKVAMKICKSQLTSPKIRQKKG